MKYIWGPRERHVRFIRESFEGRCSPPLYPPLCRAALLLSLFRRSIPSSETRCWWVPFTELLTKSWGSVKGLTNVVMTRTLHLPGESTLKLPEAMGQADGGQRAGLCLSSSSLCPWHLSWNLAFVRKGPLGAGCFYGLRTRGSEKRPCGGKEKKGK